MVIIYKALVSLTSVFKSCSPDLERVDFDRQSYQYTWFNSYFFSSLRESNKTKHTSSGKCRRVVQGGPERSWSTKGVCGPRGPPGPLRSILIHTF